MFPEIFLRTLGTAVGICYPAYLSFKALKAEGDAQIHSLTVYWIVFAAFKAAELVGDTFVFWFPFYYEAKVMFQVWLLFPKLQGANFIYTEFILPTLLANETNIDDSINRAGESFMREGQTVVQRVLKMGRRFVSQEVGRYIAGIGKSDTSTPTHSRGISIDTAANESIDMSEYDIINRSNSAQSTSNPNTSTSTSSTTKKRLKKKPSNTSLQSNSARSRQPSTNVNAGASGGAGNGGQDEGHSSVGSWLNWLANGSSEKDVAMKE